MPLDATQLKLDEVKRAFLFSQGTPLTDALTLLYHQWGQETPTLFDPMTITFLVNPNLCPVQPMHIRVDEKGFTRPTPAPPTPKSASIPIPTPSSASTSTASQHIVSHTQQFPKVLYVSMPLPDEYRKQRASSAKGRPS